jgi:Flp pilus assembly protein TadD
MPKPAVTSLHKTMRSAEALLAEGKQEQALAMFERLLKAVPNDPAVVCGVASICGHLGLPERAEKHLRAALKRGPTSPTTISISAICSSTSSGSPRRPRSFMRP